MGNTCEALVAAFWIDVFEANGMLSVEEAIELQHKIFEGKEVANDDYEYQAEPVA